MEGLAAEGGGDAERSLGGLDVTVARESHDVCDVAAGWEGRDKNGERNSSGGAPVSPKPWGNRPRGIVAAIPRASEKATTEPPFSRCCSFESRPGSPHRRCRRERSKER